MYPQNCGFYGLVHYITQHVRLHLLSMQGWLKSMYLPSKHHMHIRVQFTQVVLSSLNWWKDPLPRSLTFSPPLSTKMLVTDSYMLDWGAHLDTHKPKISGLTKRLPHINILELRALCPTCTAFLPMLGGLIVQVMTNNTIALFYVSRQAGA